MKWAFQSIDARAAYDARTDLVAYLRSRATSDSDIPAAELIYGELVGNAVRHAPGPIDVAIEWQGGRAVLTIVDSGPGFAMANHPSAPDSMSEGGRGLFIVAALSESFEAKPTPEGGMCARAWLPVKRL